MSVPVLSLAALVVAIVLSMTSRINVGLVAIVFAWIIGVYVAGLKPDELLGGFPVSLFMTLVGVTLLFGITTENGTLARVALGAVQLARGNARVIPLILFLIACAVSSLGPGAISTVALVVPLAMVIGDRAGIAPLLTALMVANGANAGNLSPISSVGIIANTAMAKGGVGAHPGKVWFANFVAHAFVAVVAYALFARSRARSDAAPAVPIADAARPPHAPIVAAVGAPATAPPLALTSGQRLTLLMLGAWIVGVVVFRLHLGLSAFAAASVLLVLHAADEGAAIRQVPWGVILMVSGVSLLIALLEKTGGMELFTDLLARLATPSTVNGVIAFVTGAISTYSSTSGVVLPAFLPTASGLVERLGGGDPLAVALSINVGSSVVDVSPLSTLGALCVAAVAEPAAARRLFKQLLTWGLSMTLVAALLCQLFAGWLARA